MKKNYLLTMFLMLLGTGAFAQSNFFTPAPAGSVIQGKDAAANVKNKGIFQLNEQGMRTYLLTAPLEFNNNGRTIPLQIPLPNGSSEIFNIVESPILSAEQAILHPEIKTYTGKGTTDKNATIRLSLTSSGFNAIILNVGGNGVYFEKSRRASNIYFNYFTKDAGSPKANGGDNLHCGAVDSKTFDRIAQNDRLRNGLPSSRLSSGATLYNFRIAIAGNGEFTANYGGNVTAAYNAIAAYVNRMTAVYRNELSVSFTLVSGTSLVYTDTATDPYTNADDIAMLGQNITNLDNVVGNANYDLGHVLGAEPANSSAGGIAYTPAVCVNTNKGGGVSKEGDLNAFSQLFTDQVLFHETGHQFSMTHSYNADQGPCTTRNQATSVEPGSGATIMSYGFICQPDDYFSTTQGGLFLNFHSVSYQQAIDYIGTISCYTSVATGNTPPVVTMPPAYTIPKSTPFSLTGSASDANSDQLTYSWEGTNVGSTAAPTATTLTDPAQSPWFRSYEPVTSSTRIYPVLDSILNGSNYSKGDKLPSVSVVTTHTLTVRDNNPAGGGVTYGSVSVTVDAAIGPFLETTNLLGSYASLSNQTITWSVNGTNTATPNVKISLSTDGGFTFPYILAASTPNDGSETVTLPAVTTMTARIKVEAVGNIFFDISNNNFTIGMILPVDLLSFNVSLKGKKDALVTWETATETNLKGFEVEMSKNNATAFKNVGFMQGKGTTTQGSKYEMTVPGLLPGTYYFRLKTVDLDGKFSYSTVRQVTVSDDHLVSIYPNPTQDGRFKIELAGTTNKHVTVKITNAIGQLISNSGILNYTGPINMQIKAGPGEYNIQVIMADGTSVFKKMVNLK